MCQDAGRIVRWVVCVSLLAGGLHLEGDEPASSSAVKQVTAAQGITAAHRALGRGVNLGNALEAPREGEWGMVLASEFFGLIRKAGFDHVRVPTKWSAHASPRPPYSIDSRFAERVDWVLDQAQAQGLRVVLNVHHYDELDNTPDEELPRAVAIWEQIATRYRDRGDWLYFELMNEPHERLNEEGRWNRVLPALLKAVRRSNRTRPVIVGPAWWNGIDALDEFQLPDDPNLIITVHCYLPFPFTHQGASWVEGSDKWIGRRWGSPSDERELAEIFAKAEHWAQSHRRPIYLGEFGVYQQADMESRVRWTRAVVREAERRGWTWAYWEFGAGFGVYDREQHRWRTELLAALVGSPRPTLR